VLDADLADYFGSIPVYTENLVWVDGMMESPKLAA
jgi:hypothetical protein